MKDQINTIREALKTANTGVLQGTIINIAIAEALAALDKIEASAAKQYEAGDVASASAQGFRDGVASVAQQPQAEAVPSAQPAQAEAVWVNPELEHMAEAAECVSMCLNDRGVPSKDGSKPLSLWGRVEQYANPRFLEGMTTKDPQVSSEHIKALAKASGLIGSYTTAEFVRHVVGFAHVLLGNKAVQEAFVKANAHLLYAAPQQAEAVPPTHVLVPVAVLKAASESLGNFVSDLGWTDADMQAMDNLDAILAQTKGGQHD